MIEKLEGRKKKGLPCEPIDTIPKISKENEYLWEYFWQLGRTRPYEQGIPLPITFTEINSFLQLGFPISNTRNFIDVILVLDDYYLTIINKQSLSKIDKVKNKKKK